METSEIRKFSVEFSKNKAKLRREKLSRLEVKLKDLEEILNHDEAKEQHNPYRGEINKTYDEISSGIKIRSKCDWYEFDEKSNEFFLNFRKMSSNTKYSPQGAIK